MSADEPGIAGLSPGRVISGAPRLRWARRRVLRNQGHCVVCGADRSGLINPLPAAQFDHRHWPWATSTTYPTSKLLCQPCNGKKAADLTKPGTRLRRYFS